MDDRAMFGAARRIRDGVPGADLGTSTAALIEAVLLLAEVIQTKEPPVYVVKSGVLDG